MRQQETSALFDRVAEVYDVSVFPFFTPFGEALVEFARVGPDDRILDAGCGKGAVLAPAARRAASAVGVELSPAMAEQARAVVPGAEVVVGDAGALDFADGSFDLVLSGFVVFFFEDPTAALREWARVLHPGGRIAISTWAEPDPRWSFERDLRRSFAHELPPEFIERALRQLALLGRFDSEEKVAAELAAAGLADVESASHTIEFVFPDEEAWLDWNNSHGARAYFEALSEGARRRYHDESVAALQPLRTGAGFPRRYTAIFATARRDL